MPAASPSDTTLSPGYSKSLDGAVRAVMWPTRALATRERWFDELYIWTEGLQASTMQRARLQLNALRKAFALIELECSPQIGVTLSFGTIERGLDLLTQLFDENQFFSHRLTVLLRGQIDRMRSPYRVQSFVDWLRTQQIPVGYRLSSPRIAMEMRAVDMLQPDFAKVMAPSSNRLEYWQDMMLETRAAGLNPDWLIVAGIETEAQKTLAHEAGFRFAQGTAIRPSFEPPSTRALRQNTTATAETEFDFEADNAGGEAEPELQV